MRGAVFTLLLGALLAISAVAHADSEARHLLARSLSASPPLSLQPDDRQWLERRKALVLGSSRPDYPPFEINTSPPTSKASAQTTPA